MPSDREQRRAERKARIAARRLRVQGRRERVQARREAAAARREGVAPARPLPPGLREVTRVATEIGTPPKEVASTLFGKPLNLVFLRINAIESSWVSHVMLILDETTGVRRLGVRFLDGYACWYSESTEADYFAMLASPSKGRYIWNHWYGAGKRRITAATSGGRRGPGIIAEAPGMVRTQGRRRRSFSS